MGAEESRYTCGYGASFEEAAENLRWQVLGRCGQKDVRIEYGKTKPTVDYIVITIAHGATTEMRYAIHYRKVEDATVFRACIELFIAETTV